MSSGRISSAGIIDASVRSRDNEAGYAKTGYAGSAAPPPATPIGTRVNNTMVDLEAALSRLHHLACETRGKLIGHTPQAEDPAKNEIHQSSILHTFEYRLRKMLGVVTSAADQLSDIEREVFNE